MKFTNSDADIRSSIQVLDKLINTSPEKTMEIIRTHKKSTELDIFTSYRINKELSRINWQF